MLKKLACKKVPNKIGKQEVAESFQLVDLAVWLSFLLPFVASSQKGKYSNNSYCKTKKDEQCSTITIWILK